MVKINYSLLPVKAHYFFFMAAMGPVLPFLSVIGKQLGLSEVAMGLIMSVTPILFMVAKPIFGFILDYFRAQRKTVFIALLVCTTLFFALLQFIPPPSMSYHRQISCESIPRCGNETRGEDCQLMLPNHTVAVKTLENSSLCALDTAVHCNDSGTADLVCDSRPAPANSQGLYTSPPFWLFVVLFSAGNVGYSVANSVSDAICFDMLGGGNEKKYGRQRVWGTMGFGLSALLGGYCVDLWSGDATYKDYSPAYLIAVIFTSVDLLCCSKLKLPEMPQSANILKDVTKLVRLPSVSVFLLYAAFLGICESFIIFFLFWYLEDLALATGGMHNIKLLQGLTIAGETLIGEIIFFPLSGRILQVMGYGHCLTLCFLVYCLRLGLLSLITDPWWVLPIELLQGPSYALGYTTVVAYASAISPPGTSATMQGIAAGMDDGFGYSVGSLVGGLLYKAVGGGAAFRLYAGFALLCSITHALLYIGIFRHSTPTTSSQTQEKRAIYNPPKEAAELVAIAS